MKVFQGKHCSLAASIGTSPLRQPNPKPSIEVVHLRCSRHQITAVFAAAAARRSRRFPLGPLPPLQASFAATGVGCSDRAVPAASRHPPHSASQPVFRRARRLVLQFRRFIETYHVFLQIAAVIKSAELQTEIKGPSLFFARATQKRTKKGKAN